MWGKRKVAKVIADRLIVDVESTIAVGEKDGPAPCELRGWAHGNIGSAVTVEVADQRPLSRGATAEISSPNGAIRNGESSSCETGSDPKNKKYGDAQCGCQELFHYSLHQQTNFQ